VAAVLFRLRNSNSYTTSWSFTYHATAYYGWSEAASVAVNGVAVHHHGEPSGTAQSISVNLVAGMNTVIVVATSSADGGIGSSKHQRMCNLGFTSWTLPSGVQFEDDLFNGASASNFASSNTERPASGTYRIPIYRWNVFNTYTQSNWVFNNDASLFGGVAPSTWTDGGGMAYQMSTDLDNLRTFYTRTGHYKILCSCRSNHMNYLIL
jgi:hypothetical protein